MSLLQDWPVYLYMMGPYHAAAAVLLTIILLVRGLRRRRGEIFRSVACCWWFVASLLIAGALFHSFWSSLICTRLYCNWDYAIDFMPFWPPGRTEVTLVCDWPSHEHARYPAPYMVTFGAWVGFAVASWVSAIWIYKAGRVTARSVARVWRKRVSCEYGVGNRQTIL